MKLRFVPLLLPIALAASACAQSVSFNIQSIGGSDSSYIEFTPLGGNNLGVTFLPDSAGADFAISGATTPNLDAFTGTITGTFTISGFVSSPTLEQGTVTSMNGAVTISDGMGNTETAKLWWNSAFTLFQTGGISYFGMSAGPAENLSQFTYSGAPNSALQQDFAGINAGSALISFSFAMPPSSLTDLAAASTPTTDSFSGQFTAIPEPSTYAAVLGTVALLLAFALRSRPIAV